MKVREILKTYDYDVIGINVNQRGKSYIDIAYLPRAIFPGVPFGVPFLPYEGKLYTPPEYATGLAQRRAGTSDATAVTTIYPTVYTSKVTAMRHGITRTFTCNFGCNFNTLSHEPSWYLNNGTGLPKKKGFVNLADYFRLAYASKWCREVFSSWKNGEMPKEWKDAIYSAEVPFIVPNWKEKAFCTPEAIFIGVKPGNTLSSNEVYRYIRPVKNKQGKVRSDKIILPPGMEETLRKSAVSISRRVNGTVILRYAENYTFEKVEGRHELVFTPKKEGEKEK